MSKHKGGHSYSILQGKEKYCLVTGRKTGLDKHHIYHGTGLRQISDKHGFWCYIAHEKHIAGLGGLHAHPNSGLDLELKQRCQRKFEETHTREEFMEIIGRNYLCTPKKDGGSEAGFAEQSADREYEEIEEQTQEEGGFYLL